jgi:hypothetical protein
VIVIIIIPPAPLHRRTAVLELVFKPTEREYVKGFGFMKPASTRTIAFKATLDSPEAQQKIPIEVWTSALTFIQSEKCIIWMSVCQYFCRAHCTLCGAGPALACMWNHEERPQVLNDLCGGGQMSGRAVAPALQVSHEALDFGPCPLHDRR